MSATENVTDFIERTQEAMAPAIRFNEFAAKSFERIARKQWQIASDVAEIGFATLNNTAGPKTDVQAFISAQQELAGKLGETITKGSLELIEIARESQGEAFDLFTRQATEVAEQTKDVVEKAKKSAAKG